MDTPNTRSLIVNAKRGFFSTLGDIAVTTVIFFFTVLDEDIRNIVNFQGEYLIQILRALGITGPLAGFVSNLRSPVDGGGVTEETTVTRPRATRDPLDSDPLIGETRDLETPRPRDPETRRPAPPRSDVDLSPVKAEPANDDIDDVLYPSDAYSNSTSTDEASRLIRLQQDSVRRLATEGFRLQTGPVHEGLQLGPVPLRKNSGYVFSQRSLKNRSELSVIMQRVATRGLAYSPFDWVMIEAARTVGEQHEMVDKGLSKTIDSRHTEQPAEAFDIKILDPITGKGTDNPAMYQAVAKAIRQAAQDEGVSITSGALDWGWDLYHFERDREEFPFRAPDIVLA